MFQFVCLVNLITIKRECQWIIQTIGEMLGSVAEPMAIALDWRSDNDPLEFGGIQKFSRLAEQASESNNTYMVNFIFVPKIKNQLYTLM